MYHNQDICLSVRKVQEWLASFLAKPNQNLGRAGAVCPFVSTALAQKTIQIIAFPGHIGESQIIEVVKNEIANLQKRITHHPDQRPLHVAILTFPAAEPLMIEMVQDKLKEEIVAQGLMIGEFHPNHSGPGLHNANFHPMRAPMPMLVLREMVRPDIYFLNDAKKYSKDRIQYFKSTYNRLFAKKIRSPLAHGVNPS